MSFGISPQIGANRCKELQTKEFEGVTYYLVVLTVLELANHRQGLPYAKEYAEKIVENSPSFRRRMDRGLVSGEWGHPKFTPGMSKDQFINRCGQLHEQNEAFHVLQAFIDDMQDEKGDTYPAIWGWITPSGPKSDAMKAKLDNPNQNVCFSLRGTSLPRYVDGVLKKCMTSLWGWDVVGEPGIDGSWKFNATVVNLESLSLESMDFPFDIESANQEEFLIAMESNDSGFDLEELNANYDSIFVNTKVSHTIEIPRHLQ